MKKTVSFVLCCLITIGTLVFATSTVCAANNPYDLHYTYTDKNNNSYEVANCTYVAWQQAYDRLGIALPGLGWAQDWFNGMQKKNLYPTGSEPRANSIVCYNVGWGGHVAFVTSVNGDQITVVENSRWNGSYEKSLVTRTRSGTVGSKWNGDYVLQGYIYLSSDALSDIKTTVDFKLWESTSKTFIKETNASLGQEITFSGGKCTDTGMYLYDKKGNFLAKGANGYYYPQVYFNINEELGYTLTPDTTYKYKFFAVVNGETYWSNEYSFKTNKTNSSNATVSFASWENSTYTFIGETNASIGQEITISGGTGTDTGVYLYDKKGNFLAKGANGYYYPQVYFNINEELGYTLTPDTTYKYKFFAVVNDETYWSKEYSFITKAHIDNTATNGVQEKLNKVLEVYPTGSYFTVASNTSGCSSSNHNVLDGVWCKGCYLPSIPARGGLPSGADVGYGADTCCGFAAYVYYCIFGHSHTSNITNTKSPVLGDLVHVDTNSNGLASSHWFIYISEDDKNYYVYDANGYDCAYNKVKYNNYYPKNKVTKITVYHANNYDTVYGETASINPESYYLDLNGFVDGNPFGSIEEYGTVDVYINGSLAADDCTDYYTQLPVGTRYEIKDIKAAKGKRYEGLKFGSLSGTIGSSDVDVRMIYTTQSQQAEETTYTLYYNPLGGIEPPSPAPVYAGDKLKISSIKPTKDGYKFLGWSESASAASADYVDYIAGDLIKLDRDTTLYAVWERKGAKIILTIGSTAATVNGETRYNDVAPLIENSRTMLPARFVAENLGATVEWDGDTRSVIVSTDDTVILMYIDSATAFVNGYPVTLDSAPFIRDSRTYTPVRFICESLGAAVGWDESTRQVTITK